MKRESSERVQLTSRWNVGENCMEWAVIVEEPSGNPRLIRVFSESSPGDAYEAAAYFRQGYVQAMEDAA